MSLDVQAIATAMIDAARAETAGRWPELRALGEPELRRLALALDDVAGLQAAGSIKEPHARQLAHLYQIGARSVLQTVDGIALFTAERTIHAGIRAVARTVNGAVEFALL